MTSQTQNPQENQQPNNPYDYEQVTAFFQERMNVEQKIHTDNQKNLSDLEKILTALRNSK